MQIKENSVFNKIIFIFIRRKPTSHLYVNIVVTNDWILCVGTLKRNIINNSYKIPAQNQIIMSLSLQQNFILFEEENVFDENKKKFPSITNFCFNIRI